MHIRRDSTTVHPVTDPALQKSIFRLKFTAPWGEEDVTVTVTGQQDPRAVVWVLDALGSPDNLMEVATDLMLVQRTPCPVHEAERIVEEAFDQEPPPPV